MVGDLSPAFRIYRWVNFKWRIINQKVEVFYIYIMVVDSEASEVIAADL